MDVCEYNIDSYIHSHTSDVIPDCSTLTYLVSIIGFDSSYTIIVLSVVDLAIARATLIGTTTDDDRVMISFLIRFDGIGNEFINSNKCTTIRLRGDESDFGSYPA